MEKTKVLMVCMGNICRSPMAHGVLESKIRAAGLGDQVWVDSAGTHGYHVGEPPDRRAQAMAHSRGYDITSLRARRLVREDFDEFDYILVMDADNWREARALQTAESRARLHRFMEFAPQFARKEVPDPYYGGERGFVEVMDMVEAAAEGFIAHLRSP